jgi:hypothetical protein
LADLFVYGLSIGLKDRPLNRFYRAGMVLDLSKIVPKNLRSYEKTGTVLERSEFRAKKSFTGGGRPG